MNPNANQKVHKGWLSRWTRKQWSPHWFVLKNGSLTYYRGPAAELCSFLDGVLDLSLIRHIEVQQVDGPSQLDAAAKSHHLHLQQQQRAHHYSQASPLHQSLAANSLGSHYYFTLKMWNGESHVLGAASLAERSQWLDAINSSTNGELADDETSTDSASSTSSDSAPASSLSAKSADIGLVGKPASAGRVVRAADGRHYYQVRASSYAGNLLQQHQHQEAAAAQLSLDQLAMRLKSAIRRRSDEVSQQVDLAAREMRGDASVKLPNQNFAPELSAGGNKSQRRSDAEDVKSGCRFDEQQSAKLQAETRNSITTTTAAANDDDDNNNERPTMDAKSGANKKQLNSSSQQHHPSQPIDVPEPANAEQQSASEQHKTRTQTDAQDQEKSRGQKQAIKRRLMCAEASDAIHLDAPRDPKLITHKSRDHQRLSSELVMDADLSSGESAASSSSDTDDDDGAGEKMCVPRAPAARILRPEGSRVSSQSDSSRPTQRRVTFDLKLVTAKTISDESSASSVGSGSETNSGDEDEDDDEDIDTKSGTSEDSTSISSASSSDDERQDAGAETETPAPSAAPSTIQRKLGTRADDDDDSTCEMVRRMIARRRLGTGRAPTDQNQDVEMCVAGATCQPEDAQQCDSRPRDGATAANDVDASAGGRDVCADDPSATTTTTTTENPTSSELALAQRRVEQLERKLSDSYANFSQLELTCKKLESELADRDERHQSELSQLQLRVAELTRELAAARERMQIFEEQPRLTSGESEPKSRARLSLTGGSRLAFPSSAAKALSWLRANQQLHQEAGAKQLAAEGGGLGGSHVPLLLVQHVKQTLAVSHQQAVGAKLLSQSRQIQRRLNALECKVDRISGARCALPAERFQDQDQEAAVGAAAAAVSSPQPSQ